MSSGCGWKINVRCGVHIHALIEDLDGYDILDYLKHEEIQFVNILTKYHMASIFIMGALND